MYLQDNHHIVAFNSKEKGYNDFSVTHGQVYNESLWTKIEKYSISCKSPAFKNLLKQKNRSTIS